VSASVTDTPLTLVVVDDDEHIRRAVGRLLRSHGHRVVAFDSAEAYLAGTCDADCVILDIGLPGMSGLELNQRLTAHGPHPPIVFVTAYDELKVLAAVQETQCPFLRKPIDEIGLLDAIARATGDHA
jgi:FixJ family two-component response regulator